MARPIFLGGRPKSILDVGIQGASSLGSLLAPDPVGDARAGLINAQAQAAGESTKKDIAQAAQIALQNAALGRLGKGIPTVLHPDGVSQYSPDALGQTSADAIISGNPSALGGLLTGTNEDAQAYRDARLKNEGEAATRQSEQNFKQQQADRDAENTIRIHGSEPTIAPAGSHIFYKPGDPKFQPSGAGSVLAGGAPQEADGMPDPSKVDPSAPIQDQAAQADREVMLPTDPGNPQYGMMAGDPTEPDSTIGKVVAGGIPVLQRPGAPLQPQTAPSTAAAINPPPAGTPTQNQDPVFVGDNEVSIPPKINTNIGSLKISPPIMKGMLEDVALVKRLKDLKDGLTMPDASTSHSDPDYQKKVEAVEANKNSFHPYMESIPGVGQKITDYADPSGTSYRSKLSAMANTLLHDLSGAAVTDPEWQRLSQGIANIKDINSDAALVKLNNAIDYLEKTHLSTLVGAFSPQNGYVSNTELAPYYQKTSSLGSTLSGGDPSTSSVPSSPIPVGHIDSGYQFQGGDPANPASWKKL